MNLRMRRWWRITDWLVLAMAIASVAIWRTGDPSEVDPYWQARAGWEWLHGGSLAPLDTWGYGYTGSLTFYPNSPLWNALLGVAWYGLGSWGIFLLGFVVVVAELVLLASIAFHLTRSVTASTFSVLLCSLFGAAALSARATSVALTLAIATIVLHPLLARRMERLSRTRGFLLVAASSLAISLLGNWLHTSWGMLALLMAGLWILLWGTRSGSLSWRDRLLFSLASMTGFLVGILAGPYGLQVFVRTAAVKSTSRDLISEWQSVYATDARGLFIPLVGVLILLSGGMLVVMARKQWRTRTYQLSERDQILGALSGFTLVFAVMGIWALRFVETSVLSMAPVLAVLLLPIRKRIIHIYSPENVRLMLALGVAIVVVVSTPAAFARHGMPKNATSIASLPKGCNLFAPDIYAGQVDLLRPDIRVWYDGRADMWGSDRIYRYNSFLYGTSGDVAPPQTTCIALPENFNKTRDYHEMNEALEQRGGWVRHLVDGDSIWLPSASEGTQD